MAGWWPPRFQIRVLPWLRRMRACASRWLANKSHTGRTRSGCTTAYMPPTQKGVQGFSGWSCACAACSAGYWPKENEAGIKGSPCSPPLVWVIEWGGLAASCHMYSDSRVPHADEWEGSGWLQVWREALATCWFWIWYHMRLCRQWKGWCWCARALWRW